MMDSSGHWVMDWAPTAQAIATTVAVLLAGVWAVWRVWSFRELKGFLVITQAVSHVQIGAGALHLHVLATLHNRSRVLVRPERGFCYIEGVRQDAIVESMQVATEEHSGNPMDYVTSKELSTAVDLEPGEELQYQFDFLIQGHYKYLRSHVYIKNPKKRGKGEWGVGWESIELYNWQTENEMAMREG